MIIPSVDASKVKKALKKMKDLEPDTIKDLRRELRTKLGPMAKAVAAAVPTEPPLSRMDHNGGTSWSPVKGTVSLTPGSSKKKGYNLVKIMVTPAQNKRGFYLAEMAGMRNKLTGANRGYTRQTANGPVTVKKFATGSGSAFIRNINSVKPMKGRGGRYAFDRFRELRPDAVSIATKIVNDRMTKINISLDV